MRRLTAAEMAHLGALAGTGRRGPARCIEALWDLILTEAEGVTAPEAAERPGGYRVQDYALPTDQGLQVRAMMITGSEWERRQHHLMWFAQSPCDYDPGESRTV